MKGNILCNQPWFFGFSPAVGRGAPARIWISSQVTPQLVLLIALQQRLVVQDGADVQRRQRLGALRARDAHPALRYLDAQVLAEAVGARSVGAGGESREVATWLTEQAQWALLQVLVQQLLLAGGGDGQDAGGTAEDPAGALSCGGIVLDCRRRCRWRTSSFFSFASSLFCCEAEVLWTITELLPYVQHVQSVLIRGSSAASENKWKVLTVPVKMMLVEKKHSNGFGS